MKVLTLLGSPRKNGNSATLAVAFNETARALGAEVETVALNNLSYAGCQACDGCKNGSERCVLTDDLTPVLRQVESADVLVLATPVYFSDISAQLKACIDRCYSFLKPYASGSVPTGSRLPAGKRMVFIVTQNWPDEEVFRDIHPRYDMMFKAIGFEDSRCVRGCALGPRDAIAENSREDLLQLAEEIARDLFSQGIAANPVSPGL